MRILLVRPGAIGDSLLTFPVMQASRIQHSAVHITFVSNAAVLPLAQAYQLADDTFEYSSPLWSQLFLPPDRYSHRFRALLQSMDEAICWLRDDDGMVEQGLRAAGIQRVTVAPGRPSAGEHVHIVDYLLRTVGMGSYRWRVGAGDPQGHNPSSSATPAPTGMRTGDPLSSNLTSAFAPAPTEMRTGDPQGPVAIHPGSGGAYKCWPVSSFITIIEMLLQRSLPVLLIGGPADAARVEEIEQHMHSLHAALPGNDARSRFSMLINAPLLSLAAQLQHCRGYLGNDAGITHLAAMLGIPTIALFGPSDPAIWHPVGPHVHILHEPDLRQLSPDTVMHAIETFILL